jgi:hypothetical protein
MNWKTVKNLGQIKYFNISYAVLLIVPIAANFIHLINGGENEMITLPENVKWLYTASLIYAFAISIYQYKCPEIIKEYSSAEDYVEKNQKQFENKFPDIKLNIVLPNLKLPAQSETKEKILALHKEISESIIHDEKVSKTADLDHLLNLVYPSTIQNHLTNKYETANNQGKWYIWLSATLYAAGTIIIFFLLILKTLIVYSN